MIQPDGNEKKALEIYKELAAEAAEYEFRMRLLANKTDLRSIAIKGKLCEIEAKLLKKFKSQIEPADKDFLKGARQIRNKIMHANLSKLIKILENSEHALGEDMIRGYHIDSGQPFTKEQEKNNVFFSFLKLILGGGSKLIIEKLQNANNVLDELASLND